MQYFIGLDNGGTITKAALIDRNGNEIHTASIPTKALTPHPGHMERDMDEMWEANCAVIRSLLQETGVQPSEIAAVGVCGHGKGLYLWGTDEKPVRNGILSSDNRAYRFSQKWKADGTEQAVFARSFQHIMACQPVALLAWLKENEPGVLEKTKWVFECKDYIRFRLTGEARAELTDYSGANLVNLRTKQYDPELLNLFGLGAILEKLPPLCASTEICGRVTAEASEKCGLTEGTPVIGGMFDIDACALALDVVDSSHICMIAGTWSINEYPSPAPILDGSVEMNSLFCLSPYYLVEESSATSAGNNEWFVKELLPEVKREAEREGKTIYDVLNAWVEEIPPEEFVPIFLPFLMASNVHPNAKGSLIGLMSAHTRKHLVRGVYEGIAFCHRYHLEKLLKTRSALPESIRLAGGVTRSAVWTQMFADVMQLPIEPVEVQEAGALGCAIAAAVAVGTHPTLDAAAAAMCKISPRVMPDPSKKQIYDRKYALYRSVIDCLDPLWDEMQALVKE